jgi:transcriptional regulator with XRE-family HTH domain
MARTHETPALGPRLQQIRKARGLTLEQLAARSAISRSMLSQIERGAANPTFATLWQLTRSLDLELGDLIGGAGEARGGAVEVITAELTPEIRVGEGACVLRILGPASHVGRAEWYLLTIAPGGALVSEPHARGASEHITMLEGEIEIAAGGASGHVRAGDTARYAADLTHSLANPGQTPARALLMVSFI